MYVYVGIYYLTANNILLSLYFAVISGISGVGGSSMTWTMDSHYW